MELTGIKVDGVHGLMVGVQDVVLFLINIGLK
jgi:hypothetical protein